MNLPESVEQPPKTQGDSNVTQSCCAPPVLTSETLKPYRRALWFAFVVNAAMFVVEIIGALQADALSLLADAIDFFGDSANYLVSLLVLGASIKWRARTALLKGCFMAGFGLFILFRVAINWRLGTVPEATTMGVIGLIALAANLLVTAVLFRFRQGDANMRAVWLCTRNDSLSNIAVVLAAIGVFGTGTNWPDLLVAAIMAGLALSSARTVINQALAELKSAEPDDQANATP
ncbi:MAG: cation transporter [Burkholderiaceae bacterium]